MERPHGTYCIAPHDKKGFNMGGGPTISILMQLNGSSMMGSGTRGGLLRGRRVIRWHSGTTSTTYGCPCASLPPKNSGQSWQFYVS